MWIATTRGGHDRGLSHSRSVVRSRRVSWNKILSPLRRPYLPAALTEVERHLQLSQIRECTGNKLLRIDMPPAGPPPPLCARRADVCRALLGTSVSGKQTSVSLLHTPRHFIPRFMPRLIRAGRVAGIRVIVPSTLISRRACRLAVTCRPIKITIPEC